MHYIYIEQSKNLLKVEFARQKCWFLSVFTCVFFHSGRDSCKWQIFPSSTSSEVQCGGRQEQDGPANISSTGSPCERSTRRDLMFFSHQQQLDHRASPLKTRLAMTSSVNLVSTRHSWVLSESPPPQYCSLQQTNEPHLWGKWKRDWVSSCRAGKTNFTLDSQVWLSSRRFPKMTISIYFVQWQVEEY